MVSGWTMLASLVWVAVGIVIGLLTAALLVARRDDTEDDTEVDGDEAHDQLEPQHALPASSEEPAGGLPRRQAEQGAAQGDGAEESEGGRR